MTARAGFVIMTGLLAILMTQEPMSGGSSDAANNRDYWIQRAIDWRNAILRHVPGEQDDAAATIGAWPERDLEVLICIVKMQTSFPGLDRNLVDGGVLKTANALKKDLAPHLQIPEDANPILKRGALLHSDIAMLQLETGMAHASAADTKIIVANDGRGIPLRGGWNWKLARILLDSVSPHPSRDEMTRQWYVATTAHLFARRDWGYLGPHLTSALRIYPTDARFLFYSGVLHEMYASSYSQNSQLPSGMHKIFASKESELKTAGEYLQKAVEADPAFVEAHLHMGRVVGLCGDHARAVEELKRAASAESDSQILYYCALFLGNELAGLNRRSEAQKQFEQAAALYPDAQSPLLALSMLARKGGDSQTAAISIRQLFALPSPRSLGTDPWWIYDLSHVRNAPSLMANMHKMFGEIPQ
jgi:hypothetical protein